MTARKVITRSGNNVSGNMPSHKMGKMIPWESTLERDAILHLEFSHTVKKYWAQPMKFYFYTNNQQKYCYPDFRAEGPAQELTHIEVKPLSELECPVLRARLGEIKKEHQRQGIDYQIWDETFIRRQPRLANLELLRYHLPGLRQDLNAIEDATEKLKILSPKTVGGAFAVLKMMETVYQLLALGHYSFDLDQPITMETEIFRREVEK